jgi:hypothetical protein
MLAEDYRWAVKQQDAYREFVDCSEVFIEEDAGLIKGLHAIAGEQRPANHVFMRDCRQSICKSSLDKLVHMLH